MLQKILTCLHLESMIILFGRVIPIHYFVLYSERSHCPTSQVFLYSPVEVFVNCFLVICNYGIELIGSKAGIWYVIIEG